MQLLSQKTDNKSPNSDTNKQANNNQTRQIINDTDMESDKVFGFQMTNREERQLRRDFKIFSNLNKENQQQTVNLDEMMEDNSRSEATFSFKITDINNFFNAKDNRLSEPTYVRNLPWKIMAMPRVNADRQSKSLGNLISTFRKLS